jgi:hypothetical protein
LSLENEVCENSSESCRGKISGLLSNMVKDYVELSWRHLLAVKIFICGHSLSRKFSVAGVRLDLEVRLCWPSVKMCLIDFLGYSWAIYGCWLVADWLHAIYWSYMRIIASFDPGIEMTHIE